MKIYFLMLNLWFPLPFALIAQPSPAVIYPTGTSVRQIQTYRADGYDAQAAWLRKIVASKKVALVTGDTIALSKTMAGRLNARVKALQKKATATRDSAK